MVLIAFIALIRPVTCPRVARSAGAGQPIGAHIEHEVAVSRDALARGRYCGRRFLDTLQASRAVRVTPWTAS